MTKLHLTLRAMQFNKKICNIFMFGVHYVFGGGRSEQNVQILYILHKTAIKWSDFLFHPLHCFLLGFSGMFYVELVTFWQDLNILTIPSFFAQRFVLLWLIQGDFNASNKFYRKQSLVLISGVCIASVTRIRTIGA